jgi:hypothetical protein
MTNPVVLNGFEFRAKLGQAEKQIKLAFQKRNRKLLGIAMRNLIRRTPVHTGQTVRNYVATNGRPYGGPSKSGRPAVEPTNPLPVGAERLRGAATAEAVATLNNVDFSNPFDNFFITNKSPAVAGLEAGELPKEPFTPRSPQGMFRVTLQEITLVVKTGLV